jgi:hypothetical protein
MPRLIAPAPPPKKRPARAHISQRPLPVEPLALRPQHASQVLGIHLRTVWDWIRAGKLEVARPSPSVTLVLMTSIRRLLEPVKPPAGE